MAHPVIKFGTDGWRGVIASDFTFENVSVAAAAVAAYLHAQTDPKQVVSRGICIGYDSRFLSEAFARTCAEVVAATGIAVKLAREITPTPALSYGVRELGAAGGIMITSSHNPAQWRLSRTWALQFRRRPRRPRSRKWISSRRTWRRLRNLPIWI